MKHLSAKIYGKVQGVFFRVSAKRKADSFGLCGWVKNDSDGTVLLEVEGDDEKVKKMLDWCKIGSKPAIVEGIEERWSEKLKEYSSFTIKK